MNYQEVMKELKAVGTAQNVKVYRRHGAGDKLYGVSFANLAKFKKRLGPDQQLAEQLWKSGNTDAQTLALMIADPDRISASVVDSWGRDIRYGLLAGSLADVVARSRFAKSRLKKWTKSKKEYLRCIGYSMICSLLKENNEPLSDDECAEYLAVIELEIHDSMNQARYTMNGAVIAIGIYRPRLRTLAKQTARRIGKVHVDHGETGCKTPDAESYINKAAKRKKK